MLSLDARYHLLRKLAENPNLSQRALARELGVSLGKVNYCLRALLDKGYIKAINFTSSQNKKSYVYKLTPAGVVEKARTTRRFLAIKEREYESLAAEIAELKQEAAKQKADLKEER